MAANGRECLLEAIDYLNQVFIHDGFAARPEEQQLRVRHSRIVINTFGRAWPAHTACSTQNAPLGAADATWHDAKQLATVRHTHNSRRTQQSHSAGGI